MINVLVVDDSAFYRVNLTQLISSKDVKVIANANDGDSAISKIEKINPDVVIIDFLLAGKSGIDVIKKIMKSYPMPIILFSSFKDIQSEVAITALEAGIFDFVEKPENYDLNKLNKIKDEIINKVIAAYNSKIKDIKPRKEKPKTISVDFHTTTRKIVIVASSTGGPQTLEKFVTEIPKNIPCPILIVQHMPPIFTKSLADRLDKLSDIRVVEAKEGDKISAGTAYIAPGDYHMILEQEKDGAFYKEVIRLNKEEKEEGVRPCANKLFKSVALLYKENTIAVVLTGMGSDGTIGAKEIKKYNGSVIAQSEKTCIIYGMPKSIVDNNLADEVVDIDKMAVAMLQLVDA